MATTSVLPRSTMTTPPPATRAGSPIGYFRLASAVFIVVCLSTAPFVSLNRWVTDDPLALETWPYVYSMWGAALLGAGLFVLDVVAPITTRPLRRSESLLVAMAAPVALAVWALMSAWWTVSPARTPHEAVLMSLVLLTAMWFGYALTFRQQVWSLFIGLHVLTLSSFVLAVALDSARLAREDDAWMGLFNNPNTLSPIATLGIVAAIGAWLLTDHMWVRVAIGVFAGFDVVVALKASSATGWLALCGAVGAFALLLLGRGLVTRGVPVKHVRTGGAVVAGLAVVSIPWSIGLAADLFGKDTTFTGRRDIWDFVVDSVEDRWLVGFGWYSFWDDPDNRAELFERTGRQLDSAHSSFMETLLFLGGVGVVLLLVVVLFGFGRTWWEALGGTSWAMAWWAAVGMFAFIENVGESMIAYHSIFWLLLVAPGFAAMRYAEVSPNSSTNAARRERERYLSYTYQ
jgi:exopolysaccharide production protein ExoQ